jgi:alpha-N-arabinofuranosidase
MYISSTSGTSGITPKRRPQPPQLVPGPPLLRMFYNFMDALLVGGMLITLLKHADGSRSPACPSLSTSAPRSDSDAGARAQTIYWPYLHASDTAGTVLQTLVDCDKYDSKNYSDAPMWTAWP